MITLYWLWRLGNWLVASIPRQLSWQIAGWLGNSAYYLMPLRRRVAEENLAHVLGASPNDAHVRRAVRLSFQNYSRLLRDVMLYPHITDDEIRRRVSIINPEHLANALAAGKGVILVTAHFGNMDLGGARIAQEFGSVTIASETLRPQQLMDWVVNIRGKHGIHMAPYEHAPRRIIEALKRNEIATVLVDIGVTHLLNMVTVPVDFFGAKTQFLAGPAQIGLLTGAPIVLGFTRIIDNEHIQVTLTPPLIVQRSSDKHTTFQVTMQEIAHRMEEAIRLTPEQWYVFRPMWHLSPDKERQIRNASLSINR